MAGALLRWQVLTNGDDGAAPAEGAVDVDVEELVSIYRDTFGTASASLSPDFAVMRRQ